MTTPDGKVSKVEIHTWKGRAHWHWSVMYNGVRVASSTDRYSSEKAARKAANTVWGYGACH